MVLTAAPQLPPGVLPAGETIQSDHFLRLDPVPRLVSVARKFVGEHTPAMDESTHDTLVLLTSELVTNVVIHARTVLVVGVTVTVGFVVVTVHDLDLGRVELDPVGREGGRGLMLVKGLADRAGMYQQPDGGKTAWFRLIRRPAEANLEPVDIDAFLDGFDA